MSENKTLIGEETTKFDIHVLSQDESIIVLRMSPNMIMEKLFKSYLKLGLKDGDQIDAMLHQTGGGFTN
ncbi:hypothetical protein RDI58_023411 [Solanum bulbocastanum]|uniref:Uncharacterized protein n=1 Tax=Solanum bulbocastanum TaxID=147425 RepID=A0AAN8Y6N6_SOLBU